MEMPHPAVAEEKGAHDESPPPRYTMRTLIMTILASMGGLIFGFDVGQISGFLAMNNFRQRFGEYDAITGLYYFSNVRAGLIVGLLAIGNLFGALIAAPIANRFGRRRSISAWCIVSVAGVVIQISSNDEWYQIVVGRFIGGLGIGALSILVPLYVSESAPTHFRGTAVSFFQLLITLGILVANIINFGTECIQSSASWRITMGISFLWPLILGIGMIFLSESPKYMFRQNRKAEAREVMCKYLGVSQNHSTVAKESREMEQKLNEEEAGGDRPWYEIFTGPRMAYRTLLGIALMSFQQLTGANFFFYYGTVIFGATGMDNPFVIQIILGTVNVVCTLPGLWMIEKFGRRPCLILGAAWMCMCFLVFASVGHFALDQQDPERSPKAGAAMIVFACLFIAAFASTWGPMVWGVTADLYPARYRAVCMSLAIASNWSWVFMIAFFTPFITSAIDYRYGYLFAACCAAAAVTVYFFVIEPKGRTMEEVDNMYVARVKPWQSSCWTAPVTDDAGRAGSGTTANNSVAVSDDRAAAEEVETPEPEENTMTAAGNGEEEWESQAQYV
ncbi:hexose transporter hxt1 [Xylographa soralifera]|nr:hexose transporter hxt1 [Xylographa soralifera]